eukprot:TRINITY_DN8087_c0_g2_i1.p1 TRINITY_DN8087_c0_g2~~TRINITY_DN8087_c0_g2_i1.p1  ORF type:complete len:972 (+),score=300.57 TRINITY_DN8087_c0_g2_i1:23-2938(+)
MRDANKLRGVFQLDSSEQYLGEKLWGLDGVPCECSRKGGAKVFLFRTCIGLEYEDRQAPDVYRLSDIHLEPSWKAFIQKNSFSVPPVCFAELRIVPVDESLVGTTLIFKSEQMNGWEASRAIQFCWQAVNNELSERSHVHVTCNRFVDVVAVTSKLPVEEQCTMVLDHRAAKASGKLKLDADGVLRFLSVQGVDSEWILDDIIMIRRLGGITDSLEMKVLISGEQTATVTFTNFSDINRIESILSRSWCLNCNSVVNFRLSSAGQEGASVSRSVSGGVLSDSSGSPMRSPLGDAGCTPSPHRKKKFSPFISRLKPLPDKVCFSLDEVCKLLSTFQSMDDDSDGKLNKHEWVLSLGPVFKYTQVPHAVFSVFDTDNDGVISFSEFLFGCRILHLGSHEDRLQYQYRIFDPTGKGFMTVSQFIQVAQTLQEAVGLNIPRGMTLQDYCHGLFRQMDRNGDGLVDVLEFKDALSSHEAFTEAFEGLADARLKSSARNKIKMGKPVWFGDPQWLQCTAILLGIKLSQDKRRQLKAERGTAPLHSETFKRSAWLEKVTWELGSQAELPEGSRITKKPAPGREAAASDAHEASHTGKARSGTHPLVAYESYFTDYSPQIFQAIQERFDVSQEEYNASLGIEQLHSSLLVGALSNLNTMSSSGKSGAFFFGSHDGKFILKTIEKSEGKVLRRFLPSYYEHIMTNPHTLLTRYFGLHALAYGGEKMYFLVMNNVMQPPEHLPIQLRYDLKGSTVNRTTPIDRRKDDVALKDLDFKRKLEVSPETRKQLMNQVRADSDLLQREQLNDYSILIGIHMHEDALPESHPHGEPFWTAFHGGLPSRDRREVYYIGIIDLLTAFNIRKKTEYTVKSVWYRTGKVSCVPPEDYRERFVQFVESIFPASSPGHGLSSSGVSGSRMHHQQQQQQHHQAPQQHHQNPQASLVGHQSYVAHSAKRPFPVSPFHLSGADIPDMFESPPISPR